MDYAREVRCFFEQQKKFSSENGKDGADGKDGFTPYIGRNGNWWIGDTDTGVAAAGSNGSDGQDYSGTTETPMISISLYEGHYYWVQIINNVKTFILNPNGEKIPVDGTGGVRPIIRVDTDNYWRISFDGGITFIYIQDSDGNPYKPRLPVLLPKRLRHYKQACSVKEA